MSAVPPKAKVDLGTNAPPRASKRPRHAEAARVRTAGRGLARGHMPDQPKFSHSRYGLGCLFAAISIGLLQALVLGLGIADGFCQHLA